MKNIKVLLLSVVVIVIFSVVLVGCGGNTSSTSTADAADTATPTVTPTGPTGAEIADASLAAVKNVTTLNLDTVFNMTMDVTGGTHPGTTTLKENSTSLVDVPAKKMSTQLNLTVDLPNQGTQNITAQMYGADGWLYAETNLPLIGNQWFKTQLPNDQWAKQSGTDNLSQFLESAVKVELTGSEVVNNVDCYVLNITPNMTVLNDWMSQEMHSQQSGMDLSQIDLAKAVKDFSVKEWVAKDSKLPVQQQITLQAQITPSDFLTTPTTTQASFENLTLNVNGTVNYSGYGQAVNIVVPSDALNAQQFPSGK